MQDNDAVVCPSLADRPTEGSHMRFSSRGLILLSAVALLPLSLGGSAAAAASTQNTSHHSYHLVRGERSALTAAQVERLAAHATHRSIIIFKDQLTRLPAKGATASLRVSTAKAEQAGVLSELSRVHATHVHGFHIINAIAATISGAEAARLRTNPAIRAVVPDAM